MKEFITTSKSNRLYYLDWLRVIAFSILLFEHSAEVFVNWHFWAKNPETSTGLSYFIVFFKPWRMPLLFFISGAAVTLSFKRRNPISLVKERSIRILLPLIAAMLFVIPPQIYFIKVSEGYSGSFWDFYLNVFSFKWFPKGNLHWLHLWYLAFIFGYTLIMLPILHMLKSENGKTFLNRIAKPLSSPFILFSLTLVFAFPYYLSKAFSLHGNIGQLLFFFPFFIFGTLFGTNKLITESIKKHSIAALFCAVAITITLYSFTIANGNDFDYFFEMGNVKPLPIFLLKSLNLWFWLIAILGFGMRYLNFGSTALSYATKAVYPFYILHQTVIVIIAYYIVTLGYSIGLKLVLISVLSFLIIFLLYEFIIRRTSFTCLLFGLKVPDTKQKAGIIGTESAKIGFGAEPQAISLFNEFEVQPSVIKKI